MLFRSVVFRSTIVQAVTTDELRGRLTAAEYVVGMGGESLGSLESGALGSLTSPVTSALAGGLATVAIAAVIGLAMPGFARYRASQATGPATADGTADAAGEGPAEGPACEQTSLPA